jgi:putative ABC transport system permease protein
MYAETAVIAVLAGAVGVVLGAVAAPLLAPSLIDSGLEPAVFTVTVQPWALVGAFVTGVVVALAGVWAAARRSSRIPPLDALREAAVEGRAMTAGRWTFGPLCTAAGIALLLVLPGLPLDLRSSAGLGAAMFLLVAASLLAPVVIVPLVRVVTWPWRTSAIGMLLREGTHTAARRVASTAAPALLTVGFTVLLTGTVATIAHSQPQADAADLPAALIAAPDGVPGLSAAAVDSEPGDSRLSTRVLLTRAGSTKGYQAVGLAGATGVVVHRPLGRTLAVTWADGTTARLRVTKVDSHAAADIVLPLADVRAHDPAALTTRIFLAGTPKPAAGVRVLTARDYVKIDLDYENRLIRMFLVVLIGVTVGYTGLAVANTLLMATAARRGEFTALRMAGAGDGQVLRLATAEALLAVGVGSTLGAFVAGTALVVGVSRAVHEELHLPVPVVVPWPATTVVVIVCVVVAVGATVVPLLRRRSPAWSG